MIAILVPVDPVTNLVSIASLIASVSIFVMSVKFPLILAVMLADRKPAPQFFLDLRVEAAKTE